MSVAESVYRKTTGTGMDMNRKLIIAKALENTEKFLNEAFDNSTGTQRSDLGMYKRFALNLINVALPNLIAPELVIVHSMDSMAGYVTYLNYTAGSNKGATKKGDVFNGVFGLGTVDKDYTSARVVETVALTNGKGKLAWKPLMAVHEVVPGTRNDEISWYWGRQAIATATRRPDYVAADNDSDSDPTTWNGAAKNFQALVSDDAFKVLSPDGFEDWTDVTIVNAQTGEIEITGAHASAASVKVAYVYDNQVIPQQDLPLLNATMESIPLVAHARRIAIYYSQIAAFQAKQDYGFDLGDQLAEKAVGQLRYEIDTEICDGLIAAAPTDRTLTWSKVLPIGISKAEHYEGFSEIVEMGKQIIYDRTKRFVPNYMLIASNILPMLSFINGWQAAPVSSINGPYLAGTLNGLKVFVTPNIAPGKFVMGVNGDDMMSSAAVYAVYMPIVPTQLLQYADGGTSQGFSTLYDFKILNANLLVAGQVVDTPNLVNIGG